MPLSYHQGIRKLSLDKKKEEKKIKVLLLSRHCDKHWMYLKAEKIFKTLCPSCRLQGFLVAQTWEMQKPSINENSCSLKCVVHVHPLSALHELRKVKLGLLHYWTVSHLSQKNNKMKPKQISFYIWLNFACQKRKPLNKCKK